MAQKKFVVIAGNIGVGKSTLVDLLSRRLGWQPFYEPVAENPYLADFYRDMRAWAFHSQVFFLAHRLRIHHQLLEYPTSVVQDRSVYEDAEIFARNLYLQGHMAERDWETYRRLYESMLTFLPAPDLVVYLRASVPTLLKRIAMRGRDYERSISPEYLSQLNRLYEEWLENFSLSPVLVVPADELDFVANPEDLQVIVGGLEQALSANGGENGRVFIDALGVKNEF